MEVRVVNDEYIVLKDMFVALGRVKPDGSWTNENNKLKKIIKAYSYDPEEILKKIDISSCNAKKHSRDIQGMICLKLSFFDKYKDVIYSAFKKGNHNYNTIIDRKELCFIQNVKDFFKYDNYVSIIEQFRIMEYRVDLVIGNSCFIEFDEEYHKFKSDLDYDRMQKITLANTYNKNSKYLMNTNNYKEVNSEIKEYEGFIIYNFSGGIFIRVFEEKCLSWIPIMYEHYNEYMDFLDVPPTSYYDEKSEDLIKLKYTS